MKASVRLRLTFFTGPGNDWSIQPYQRTILTTLPQAIQQKIVFHAEFICGPPLPLLKPIVHEDFLLAILYQNIVVTAGHPGG